MNITQAKQIPLQKLVEHLGGRFSHNGSAHEQWYYSPFRPDEKTASFKINQQKNSWYDFGHISVFHGQKNGGDILDLWCDYHRQDRKLGLKNALQDLQKFALFQQPTSPPQKKLKSKKNDSDNLESSQFKILKVSSIYYRSLKEELQRRRISIDLANTYLQQGYILDTKTHKSYTGFLFANDKGGYEISIPNPVKNECIKRSTKPKGLSFLQGNKDETSIDIFEGFWDFLSWLEMNKLKTTIHHAIILNSLSFCSKASAKIISQKQKLKSVFLFMDNDVAGFKAMHYLAAELELFNFEIGTKEQIYKGYKDVNEFWMKN